MIKTQIKNTEKNQFLYLEAYYVLCRAETVNNRETEFRYVDCVLKLWGTVKD